MESPDTITISSLFYIGLSTPVVLIDVPLVYLIYTHHRLRKQKELVVMGFLCMADLMQAIAYICAGTTRIILEQMNVESEMITNKACLHFVYPILFLYSYHMVGAGTLAISIDRVFAVLFPFRYRKITETYAYLLIFVSLCYITISSGLIEAWVHTSPAFSASILCFDSEAYTPFIHSYMLYFRATTISLSILLYIPIMYKIFRSAPAIQRTDMKGAYSSQMLRTTRTIGLTSLAGLLLIVIPDMILNFDFFGLNEYRVVWYTIQMLKSILNILLFTTRHDELRAVIRSAYKNVRRGSPHSHVPTMVTQTSARK